MPKVLLLNVSHFKGWFAGHVEQCPPSCNVFLEETVKDALLWPW